MALELFRDTLDGLPEALHGEYTKQADGKYKLSVSGIEDTSALKANNAKLLEEKKAAQERLRLFEDIGDPAKAKEAMDKLRKLEEKELLEAGEVEKVIEQRVKLMRTDHESQISKMSEASKGLTEENERLRGQLSKAVIERGLLDAANSVGQPRKEAIVDIISRGLAVFKLDENGNPVAQNPDGSAIFGKDGQKGMTMTEWAANQLEVAPHLFMPSTGGGSKGSATAPDGKTYTAEQLSKMSAAQKMELGRAGVKFQ